MAILLSDMFFFQLFLFENAVAIGLVTRRPFSVAIGPAIGHVQGTDCKRQSDSCVYFVCVASVYRRNLVVESHSSPRLRA